MALVDDLRIAAERWPNVCAPLSEFERLVAARSPGPDHVTDLYLAWAALRGDPAAVHHLGRRVRELCPRALRAAGVREYDAADLEQDLMMSLLTATDARPPILTQYTGRGTLGGWLRACAVRRCLMWRRRKSPNRNVAPIPDQLLDERADPESHSLKARDKEAFTQALSTAFAALDRSNRELLRYYYLDRLDLRQIALIYGVHLTTISRRLDKARSEVFAQTHAALAAEGSAEHIWPLVRSRLEVSLGALLKTLPPSEGTTPRA